MFWIVQNLVSILSYAIPTKNQLPALQASWHNSVATDVDITSNRIIVCTYRYIQNESPKVASTIRAERLFLIYSKERAKSHIPYTNHL